MVTLSYKIGLWGRAQEKEAGSSCVWDVLLGFGLQLTLLGPFVLDFDLELVVNFDFIVV